MEHLSAAWPIVRADLVAWAAVLGVFCLLALATSGLALLLYPNLVRLAAQAVERGEAPAVEGLFRFDATGDGLATMLLRLMADVAGLALCCVGASISNLLFFWAPHVAVEGRYAPLEAMRASLAYALRAPGRLSLFIFALAVVNTLGLLACGVGLLISLPLSVVASALFWAEEREAVYAAAAAAGVPARAEPGASVG
jgi:hypothetical protein